MWSCRRNSSGRSGWVREETDRSRSTRRRIAVDDTGVGQAEDRPGARAVPDHRPEGLWPPTKRRPSTTSHEPDRRSVEVPLRITAPGTSAADDGPFSLPAAPKDYGGIVPDPANHEQAPPAGSGGGGGDLGWISDPVDWPAWAGKAPARRAVRTRNLIHVLIMTFRVDGRGRKARRGAQMPRRTLSGFTAAT